MLPAMSRMKWVFKTFRATRLASTASILSPSSELHVEFVDHGFEFFVAAVGVAEVDVGTGCGVLEAFKLASVPKPVANHIHKGAYGRASPFSRVFCRIRWGRLS